MSPGRATLALHPGRWVKADAAGLSVAAFPGHAVARPAHHCCATAGSANCCARPEGCPAARRTRHLSLQAAAAACAANLRDRAGAPTADDAGITGKGHDQVARIPMPQGTTTVAGQSPGGMLPSGMTLGTWPPAARSNASLPGSAPPNIANGGLRNAVRMGGSEASAGHGALPAGAAPCTDHKTLTRS